MKLSPEQDRDLAEMIDGETGPDPIAPGIPSDAELKTEIKRIRVPIQKRDSNYPNTGWLGSD